MTKSTSIHRLRLKFVSAYLLTGTQGSILIDSGYPDYERLVLQRCHEQGVDPQSIALILLTHAHPDHIGSAKALRELTGAPIAIHHADADAARTGRFGRMIPRTWLGWLTSLAANVQCFPGGCTFEPDILFAGDGDLSQYGVDAHVLHTPGHTPGSLSLQLASGEAIVGDAIMPAFPRLSKPSYPIYADDLEQVHESVAKILAHDPLIIYTAHGGPMDPTDVRRFYRC